ncbi:MAG: hypothetical protein RLZZ444_272 [Pseudomonadota bacterium]|jgi:hypothetical protein
MAYIEIHPKFPEAQQRLTSDCVALMSFLQAATKEVLGVPDHDIIIELNQCTALIFNSLAVSSDAVPDVVIKIATSDKELQPRFAALSDEVVAKWNAQFGSSFKLELWINLIDTWGCNIEFS